MAGKEYAVVLAIKAADYATGPIRAVVGRLAAIRGQVSAIGRETLGSGKVFDAVRNLRGAVGGVAEHVRGALAPAFAFLGAATGGGLLALTHQVANAGDALGEMSDRLGINVEKIQELQFAAMRAGASNEQLETGLKELTKRIGEAANGTGEAKDVFAALGISLNGAGGKLKATDVVLAELADKMAKISNEAERAAVSAALLGKQGFMLAPMLAKGSAGLAEAAEEARKFGIMTEEQVKASGAFMDSMDDLGKATSGAANAIGARLLPLVQPLVDGITSWIVANRELVAGRIEDFVKRLSDNLSQVKWDNVIKGVLAFVNGVGRAVEVVGGWGNVLIGLGLIMASGPLLATLQLVGAVGQLGFAVGGVAVKFALAFGGGLVGMIMSFVLALRSGLGVMTAINIALTANPVGAIIVGITALVALGITLYNTWKPFRDMVDWIVAKVLALGKGAIGWVAGKLGMSIGDDAGDGAATPASPDAPALASPGITPPPVIAGRQEAEIKISLEAAPGTNAQLVSQRDSGGGMNVATDLDVGAGKVAIY